MNTLLIGMLGFICAAVLFGGGFAVGYILCKKISYKANYKAINELNETEARRIREENAAFDTMMNYSKEVAYGIKNPRPVSRGDE